MRRSTADRLSALTRDDFTRILATLIRLTGDITLAEDALQDAMVKALSTWDSTGIPDSPRAWVIVTARRCAGGRDPPGGPPHRQRGIRHGAVGRR